MTKEEQVLKAIEKLDTKIDNKIDKLGERLDSMEKVQIKQEANLGEHMRRTELAEENISILRSDLKIDLRPLQKHVSYMEGALKGLGIISMVIGIIIGLAKLLEYFHIIS